MTRSIGELHVIVTDDVGHWRVHWHRGDTLTLGRGPGVDIAIDDPRLARHHLTLHADRDGQGCRVDALATAFVDDERLDRHDSARVTATSKIAAGPLWVRAMTPAAMPGLAGAGGDAGTVDAELDRLRRMAVGAHEPELARRLYREGLRRDDPALCALGLATGAPGLDAWLRLLALVAGDGGSVESTVDAELARTLDAGWPARLRMAPRAWLSSPTLGADAGLWPLVRAVSLHGELEPEVQQRLALSDLFERVEHLEAAGGAATSLVLGLRWTHLTGLAISDVDPGERGLAHIVDRLPGGLRELGLRACQIGDVSAVWLARRCERPASLTSLDLGHNPMGPSGVRALDRARWFEGLSRLTLPATALRGEVSMSRLAALVDTVDTLTLTQPSSRMRVSRVTGEVVLRMQATLERAFTGPVVDVEVSPTGQAWADRHRLTFRIDPVARCLRFAGDDAQLEALGLPQAERAAVREARVEHGHWLRIGQSQMTVLWSEDFAALWQPVEGIAEPGQAAPEAPLDDEVPRLPPTFGVRRNGAVRFDPQTLAAVIAYRGEAPVKVALPVGRTTVGLDPRRRDLVLVGAGVALHHLDLVVEASGEVWVERTAGADGRLAPIQIDDDASLATRVALGDRQTLWIGPFMLRLARPTTG